MDCSAESESSQNGLAHKIFFQSETWKCFLEYLFFEILLEAGKGMSGQHMLWELNFCCYRIAVSTFKKRREKEQKIEQGRVISSNEETCLTYLDASVMNIIYQHLSNQNPSHCTLRQFSSRMYTLNLSHQTVWELQWIFVVCFSFNYNLFHISRTEFSMNLESIYNFPRKRHFEEFLDILAQKLLIFHLHISPEKN